MGRLQTIALHKPKVCLLEVAQRILAVIRGDYSTRIAASDPTTPLRFALAGFFIGRGVKKCRSTEKGG